MTTDEAMMELDDAVAVYDLAPNLTDAWKVVRAALADATARAERAEQKAATWSKLARHAMQKLATWSEATRKISEAWRDHHGWHYGQRSPTVHRFGHTVMRALASVGLVEIETDAKQEGQTMWAHWVAPWDEPVFKALLAEADEEAANLTPPDAGSDTTNKRGMR